MFSLHINSASLDIFDKTFDILTLLELNLGTLSLPIELVNAPYGHRTIYNYVKVLSNDLISFKALSYQN